MACFGPAPGDPAVGQQRPCHSDYLPLSQGDSGFFQPDGFASFAGQTKKLAPNKPAFIIRGLEHYLLTPLFTLIFIQVAATLPVDADLPELIQLY